MRTIAGKTLAEVAPGLYAEIVEQLETRNMSETGCMLSDDEVTAVLEQLEQARISEACACGQLDCKTYRFAVTEKPGVNFHTVRFHVRGELLLNIGSDGQIAAVQRLYDLSGKAVRRYVRDANGGWREHDA